MLHTAFLGLVLSALVATPVLADHHLEPVSGRWKLALETADGTRDYFVDLSQKEGVVSGTFISPRSGEHKIKSGSFAEGRLEFSFERDFDGTLALIDVEGKLGDKGAIAGSVSVSGNELATFTMKKLPSPVGEWQVTAQSPDGDETYASILKVANTEKGLAGEAEYEGRKIALRRIGWKGEGLQIEFPLELPDNKLEIVLDLKFVDKNRLKGRWSAKNTEYAGNYEATRKAKAKPKSFPVAGVWDVTATTNQGELKSVLEVTATDDGHKGKSKSEYGEVEHKKVRVDGDKVVFELDLEIDGNILSVVIRTQAEGENRLVGRWEIQGSDASGDWVASRRPKASKFAAFLGEWQATATLNDGNELEHKLELQQEGEKLIGKLHLPQAALNVRRAKVEGQKISFSIELERDSGPLRVDLTATLEKGELKGKWTTDEGDSNTWVAKRP